MEFSETVKAGMQVEMSIIKRTFHAWRERRAQSNTSPPDNAKAMEWFIWYVNLVIDYPLRLNGFVSAPILRVDGNMKSTSITGKSYPLKSRMSIVLSWPMLAYVNSWMLTHYQTGQIWARKRSTGGLSPGSGLYCTVQRSSAGQRSAR
jgi:hypothetical protein